jgi:DNA invertase Pin-like site-specific DNA recombinase
VTAAERSTQASRTEISTRGVALYLRVSTEEQDLAGQERDLRAEAQRRAWPVAAVYAEKVSATGRLERDEYGRLLGDARKPARPFDRVLVWSLDRWSRDPSFVRAVGSIEELESLGVRFHSLKEPTLDSSEDGSASVARDLLRGVLPAISSFESRRKSERVRVAMREIREGRRATRSGRPVGRPRKVTPELARRAAHLRGSGLAWREVAQRVGLRIETCRKAVWQIQHAARGVVNSQASEMVAPTPPHVDSEGTTNPQEGSD